MLDVREIFYILDISLYTYYLLQDSLSPLTGTFAQQQVKKIKELNGLDPRNFHTFLNPSLTSSVYIMFLSMDDHRIHKNPEK